MKLILFLLSFIVYMKCTTFSESIPEKKSVVSIVDPDSDCDGIPDSVDKCPGGDDTQDYDGDGDPDCIDPPPYPQVYSPWKCGTPSLQKVRVCMKTPSGGFQNVCTYYSAVRTHINNGGFLGPCKSCGTGN